MTCSEFTEFLDRYIDGELPPDEAREFERHLGVCRECVAYLDTYRRTVELGRKAFASPEEEVADVVPEELVKAILSARRSG